MSELKGIREVHKSFDERYISIVGKEFGDCMVIRDGWCQVCYKTNRVFQFDTAGGEYGEIVICKQCLNKIWTTYNKKKRIVKRIK